MKKAAALGGSLALAVGTPATAEWRASETEHFIIYSESAPARTQELAARLESYDKLMRLATNIGPEDTVKVRIYEVAGLDDIDRALGVSNSGVAGYYTSNIMGPYLVTPRKIEGAPRYFTPESTLQHEYAHHFMLQYFPAIYPDWYVEGFAELIGSSQTLPDGRIGYGMPAKHRGNEILAYWVPLPELLTREKVSYFDTYGQGWALTHFLTFDKNRSKQLRRYLQLLTQGQPMSAAATAAFGDLRKLNAEARQWVGGGSFPYTPVKVDIRRPVISAVRALSPGEAALIPEVIAFSNDDLADYRKEGDRRREQKRRETNLRRIRDKVASNPDDPFALYMLGEAEYALGHKTEAAAAVNRLLALQPGHVRGLVRKSILLAESSRGLAGPERLARAAEARALAVRANRADPNDPLPLVAYYQSYNLGGVTPTAKSIEGLAQAVQTLPADEMVRQLLVDRLAAQRRFAEAIAVLSPVAHSPHDTPRRTKAREQLAQLRAQLAQASGAPASAKSGS